MFMAKVKHDTDDVSRVIPHLAVRALRDLKPDARLVSALDSLMRNWPSGHCAKCIAYR